MTPPTPAAATVAAGDWVAAAVAMTVAVVAATVVAATVTAGDWVAAAVTAAAVTVAA